MSSSPATTTRRHNPYQQALPVAYQTPVSVTQGSGPVDTYYPSEVEVHTQRRGAATTSVAGVVQDPISGAHHQQHPSTTTLSSPDYSEGVANGYHHRPNGATGPQNSAPQYHQYYQPTATQHQRSHFGNQNHYYDASSSQQASAYASYYERQQQQQLQSEHQQQYRDDDSNAYCGYYRGGGNDGGSATARQQSTCGDADCMDPTCGVPTAACLPAGMVGSLVDVGRNFVGQEEGAETYDDQEIGDCDPAGPLGPCLPYKHHQQVDDPSTYLSTSGGASSAPPLYSEFASVQKNAHTILGTAGGSSTTSSGGRTEEDGGEDTSNASSTVVENGSHKAGGKRVTDGSVMKTTEKVIRVELNGRVPYLHFPAVSEMEKLVQQAKDNQAAEDEEILLRNPTLVGPDGKLKKSYFPVFFGQVLFNLTQTQLNWLLLHLTGVMPAAVSNASPGCFTCYFTTMEQCNAVLSLNKRLLFDMKGVWVAQNPRQTDLVFNSAKHWQNKPHSLNTTNSNGGAGRGGGQQSRLPRGALVVELPMQGGGAHSRQNNGAGRQVAPASRMR